VSMNGVGLGFGVLGLWVCVGRSGGGGEGGCGGTGGGCGFGGAGREINWTSEHRIDNFVNVGFMRAFVVRRRKRIATGEEKGV